MDEAAWLKYSGELHTRPPMPDFAVRDDERERPPRDLPLHPLARARPASPPRPTCRRARSRSRPTSQWVLPPAPRQQAPAARLNPTPHARLGLEARKPYNFGTLSRAFAMLRVTKLTDYATVVLTALAARPGRVLSAAELAERAGLEAADRRQGAQAAGAGRAGRRLPRRQRRLPPGPRRRRRSAWSRSSRRWKARSA